MDTQKQLGIYRDWQKKNPEWELVCDIPDCDIFYIQWDELSKAERMSWIGTYGADAKGAFEEFSIKKCKIDTAILCSDLKLYNIMEYSRWPEGFTMLVFKTGGQ